MLRLRVVSEQRRSLAERSSAIFSVEGGTIGRSADNDWVLPDPQPEHGSPTQMSDSLCYSP